MLKKEKEDDGKWDRLWDYSKGFFFFFLMSSQEVSGRNLNDKIYGMIPRSSFTKPTMPGMKGEEFGSWSIYDLLLRESTRKEEDCRRTSVTVPAGRPRTKTKISSYY